MRGGRGERYAETDDRKLNTHWERVRGWSGHCITTYLASFPFRDDLPRGIAAATALGAQVCQPVAARRIFREFYRLHITIDLVGDMDALPNRCFIMHSKLAVQTIHKRSKLSNFIF